MILLAAIFLTMTLGAIVFLGWPLFTTSRLQNDSEIASYFAQIDAIKANDDIGSKDADAAIIALKRQILAKQGGQTERSSKIVNGLVLVLIALTGGAVYFSQGEPFGHISISPSVTADRNAQFATDQNTELAELVGQLEVRLRSDRADDPTGWLLHARSLMTLERFEDALEAYDRALQLTDNRPDLVTERERARLFSAQWRGEATLDPTPERGPTQKDVQDAGNLSEADRQAMIESMVDGLAVRLDEAPDDPQGWARLIRARVVLGQTDRAKADVAAMRDIFADDPDTVRNILEAAQWAE